MSRLAELLEPIQASPLFVEAVEELSALWVEEQQRRAKFYQEMTTEMKVEFIEGEVILHSPARNAHLDVTTRVSRLLSIYADLHHLGEVKVEKCLCVFPRNDYNDYEPDVVFFGREKAASLSQETMKFPVPDLAVEVPSESTEERDRGVKFQDFEAHGVGEYWIIDAERQVVEQYVLSEERYELRMKSSSGLLTSQVLPGFQSPVEAFFDTAANTSALRSLLGNPG